MGAGLWALLSHWRRAPLQLAALLVGLATATALWSGVQAINAEARASYDRAAAALGATPRPRLTAAPGTADPGLADFVRLRRAGWLVTPVIEGSLDTGAGALRLIGIDPFTLPLDDLPPGAGALGLGADFLEAPGQLIVSGATAARLRGADHLPPRVTAEGVAPGIAYADIRVAARLLDRPGQLDALILLDGQPRTRPPLDEVAPDLQQVPAAQGGDNDMARLTDSFHLNLTAFGLLAFAVGLFIVRGAVGLAFEQRRPVFRTLRALGLSNRALLALLLTELLILALVAGAMGIVLGRAIAALLLPNVAATLRGLYGAAVEGTLTLPAGWWLWGLAIAVGGTLLAAGASLWQVARLPLLAPAQPRAWARASAATLRGQAVAAAALVAAALVLGLWGPGLVAGFAALGAVLLAAALLLPLVLHGALALGARTARGPLSEWFWADTRQQVPGLSLAMMALLLALAANIGVGTMVQSFRLTFTGWLDQRLAAELYVTAPDDPTARQIRPVLERRAQAVLPIWHAEARAAGQTVQVYGVADHPTYRDNWPILTALPAAWDALARGEGVLINEQLSRRARAGPGDEIELAGRAERVLGVYSDYGNTMGQVLMNQPRFDRAFPQAERRRFALRVPPGAAPEIAAAIAAETGLAPDQITDQAAIKAFSLRIFERTFAVTGALNVLTLGVAGIAMLTSLMTLAAMRLPQLAPAWALGLTRRRLARLELARAVLLAAITFVAALPVGLVLAWMLLAVVNVRAFGWRLPMHVFPADWLWLAALSLLAAGLAALWPARRIARIAPSELLKVFAHER